MAIILFDNQRSARLYPLTGTRAVAAIRTGIFTAKERWERISCGKVFIETASYLNTLYPKKPDGIYTWIDAAVLPTKQLIEQVTILQQGEAIEDINGIIACKAEGNNIQAAIKDAVMNFTVSDEIQRLHYPHQIFQYNKALIEFDYKLITQSIQSVAASSTNTLINPQNIFIEEDAQIHHSILNASEGPIYIGKRATVMEGCMLRGPLAVCNDAAVKMGTKIYGATTIGPYCTVSGEIKNVVMQAFSNKGHDGYLGDSVIGEWCNFGAGTSNSNVKNTAGDILLWNDYDKSYINVGNKCGVIMGDYTRIAINSSINTGSIYGVCCNVFGDGLLPKRLPHFSWGVKGERYNFDSAVQHIHQWKKMKHQAFTFEEQAVLQYIFEESITEKV